MTGSVGDGSEHNVTKTSQSASATLLRPACAGLVYVDRRAGGWSLLWTKHFKLLIPPAAHFRDVADSARLEMNYIQFDSSEVK